MMCNILGVYYSGFQVEVIFANLQIFNQQGVILRNLSQFF